MKEGLFIDVDTTAGPVEVTLPPVENYNIQQHIFIVDAGNMASVNPITILPDNTPGEENDIEGDPTCLIQDNGDTAVFFKSKENAWTVKGGKASGSLRPYKSLVARVSQNAPDVPTWEHVMENTLGELPTWSRTSAGIFHVLTSNPVFTTGKTWLSITVNNTLSHVGGWVDNPQDILLHCINLTTSASDDGMNGINIEIRVYP